MKTPKFGIVAVAFLLVLTSVGFGIAEAGNTHTIGEFMEWLTLSPFSSPAGRL